MLSVANSLADCLDILREAHVAVDRVLLIGVGARSEALCEVLPDTLGMPVTVPEAGEYVALGAARQAAWAATEELPEWSRSVSRELFPAGDVGVQEFRRRYALARQETQAQLG
ncbi:FGGY-family carbohydrate kinase [Glutamicibacter protophormiae]|nr:FGGY-family carbohydrate kinase [Glutamicibacter protophormiae]